MIEPITGAIFLLDFAKAVVGWYADSRKSQQQDADEIANYLREISNSLTEYADSFTRDEDIGRGHSIRNRYYLEASLSNLAWILDREDEEYPARNAIERLKQIKVHDGELVPEISAILDGGQELPASKKRLLVDEMHRAAGEFRAAADFVRVRS